MQPYETLEKEFGEWIGNPNCVACSSGTTAITLGIEALHLPPYSEIVTSEFNMIAVPRAITLAGMTPLFVDCYDDLLIDTKLLRATCSKRDIKAIIPVHIYGRQCLMEDIHWIAKQEHVYVIEDLAEAHGVNPHPDTDVACWSFYKNKIVHGEEGGMIAFKNPEHAERARCLRSLGFTPQHDFQHVPRGINGRLSNLHAEVILESLRARQTSIRRRAEITECYDYHIPSGWLMPARQANWVYDLRIKGMTFDQQDKLVGMLRERGVEARHSFKCVSMQQEYKGVHYKALKAYELSQEVIYLPITDTMKYEEVQHNAETLKECAALVGLIN